MGGTVQTTLNIRTKRRVDLIAGSRSALRSPEKSRVNSELVEREAELVDRLVDHLRHGLSGPVAGVALDPNRDRPGDSS